MAASTGPREAARKDGEIENHLMGAVNINKGTLVVVRSDGYAYPLAAPSSGRAGDLFIGVAYETINNSAGSAGGVGIRVYKTGSFVFGKASAVQADVGSIFYGADDQDVSATSTNAVVVGYAVELIDSATLRVRIDRAVQ